MRKGILSLTVPQEEKSKEREGRTKTLENPKERSKESGISVPLNHLVVHINPFDDGDG